MIPAGSMDTINFIHRIRQIGQILSRNYHKIIIRSLHCLGKLLRPHEFIFLIQKDDLFMNIGQYNIPVISAECPARPPAVHLDT